MPINLFPVVYRTPADGACDEHGRHPVYGGDSWGIGHAEKWGDWLVNHGRVSAVDVVGGEVYVDGVGDPLPRSASRWSSVLESEDAAVAVWRHAAQVTRQLYNRGFHVGRTIEVHVTVTETELHVGPFDTAQDFAPFTVKRLDV